MAEILYVSVMHLRFVKLTRYQSAIYNGIIYQLANK